MKREDIKQGIGLILVIALFGWMYHQSEEKEKELNEDIKENKVISVAYLYDFKSNRSFNHYYYVFMFNGRQVKGYENLSGFDREDCIGKFYKIVYSSKNPNHSRIFLDEEIHDLQQRIDAGF